MSAEDETSGQNSRRHMLFDVQMNAKYLSFG
jgi:hypothetical protein